MVCSRITSKDEVPGNGQGRWRAGQGWGKGERSLMPGMGGP